MFKTLLTAAMLTTLALPAMAQDGHGHHDHSGHDHSAHDHSQHGGKPELIITPITPNELKAGEENEVFTESIRPRKETQDIEIEVWSYEKNKFTQQFSNKKIEEKS